MDRIAAGIGWYLIFLFSLVAHEAAHAFTAWRLGDPTARKGGQVTLNPLPHIRREPIGTVAVPLVSYLIGGWMIGWASAPYDPEWARRNPRRAALMSFAGPAANLLLGAFFAESLLLAETGHAIGAIQIAGTANVHQMPFFVVACDYTLIGEEYYAASALLSNDSRLLGSLKASDTVKIVLIIVIALGSILATFGQTWFGEFFATQ